MHRRLMRQCAAPPLLALLHAAGGLHPEHHDRVTMSPRLKQRLWSHLWDPGSQSVLFALRAKANASERTAISNRAFSWSRPRLQRPPLPRQGTPVVKAPSSFGSLLFDIKPSIRPFPVIASSTSAAGRSLCTAKALCRRSTGSFSRRSWRREIHLSGRRRKGVISIRNKSSSSNSPRPSQNGKGTSGAPSGTEKSVPSNPESTNFGSHNYLHLPNLPKMPHRPTKEELLAAATGFWSRLKVRFKWFSIRSVRPWNADDWSAFASWFVLGNIVWIFVGTTTFFSLVIFTINTVFAQGMFDTRTHYHCVD